MTRIAFVVVLALGFSASTGAQPADGRIVGVAVDESGAVLPGVSVSAVGPDNRVLATTVTDAVGAFALEELAPALVKVTFQLEGFTPAAADVTVKGNATSQVHARLSVARRSEDVTVVGKAPVTSIPAPADVPPLPSAPILLPVPEHAHESVCGPAKLSGQPESFGTIRAARLGGENGLYATGDQLIVDRGRADGLGIGQNFTARRLFKANPADLAPTAEHTAGLVQVVAAGEHDAVVVVLYACDELQRGDTLGAFNPQPIVTPEPLGTAAYDAAATILFGDQGMIVGGPRRLLVVDRGQEDGFHAGQRLTLFRRALTTHAPVVVGDAVVVAVREKSATIRVEHASDAISFGDFAAPQRTAQLGMKN